MSAKHTPGPWQWDGSPCDYDASNEAPWLVTDAYAVGVEKTLRDGVILKGQIECLNESNARLIAAAPDLLEAVRAYVQHFEAHHITNTHGGRDFDFTGHIAQLARAAISKATGEQA